MERTSDPKRMLNSEVGNIWAGWILAKLAENWPLPFDCYVQDIVDSTGVTVESKKDEYRCFVSLLFWMKAENYIRFSDIDPDGMASDIKITQQSLVILNQKPSFGEDSIGKSLKDAAKDIGKETAKSHLADLFGQIMGGMIKGVVS